MARDLDALLLRRYQERQKEKREVEMAKQIMHVGVALATDGVIPGRDNIISLAAVIGELDNFSINVTPQDGKYHQSAFWDKHPTELETIKKDAIGLNNALDGFHQWLRKWQGRMVACTTNIDFWHLFTAMMNHSGGCPFGSIPLDTNSWYCAVTGTKTPGRATDKVLPLDLAKERWQLVTNNQMPVFGQKPTAKRPKTARDILERYTYSGFRESAPPPTPRVGRWTTADPLISTQQAAEMLRQQAAQATTGPGQAYIQGQAGSLPFQVDYGWEVGQEPSR